MCGIFGWFGERAAASEVTVQAASAVLRHRGPDDEGFESGAGWGLGFRRLSILDLSPLGHQPMCSPDGRYWIAFNGEIYNYRELRAGLEIAGETFRGASDTEVLLRLLVREGVAALGRLNGMFALALVDTQQRRFMLARDRLGVKPLYYYLRGGLRFASELKALLSWSDADPQIDQAALAAYLALGYLPNERCIFRGYQKLPPGHLLVGSLDQPERASPQAYWQLAITKQEGSGAISDAQLDELHYLLADAVRMRMRSDVPVGVFLSGGIDSGLIAMLAAQAKEGAQPLAITVSFPGSPEDETSLAKATSARAGLEHRVLLQRLPTLADIDRIAWSYDEPFGDSSALMTFALCEAASCHATVFLSGDGGDEAFGGYRRYIAAQRYRQAERLPAWTGQALTWAGQLLPELSPQRYRLTKAALPDAGFAAFFDGLPQDPALLSALPADLRDGMRDAGASVVQRWKRSCGADLLTRQQLLDYSLYLPDDILVKMDRASMAHSIEVRSPFLDYRLVEWAARLPRAALIGTGKGKLPLRELGKRLLPPAVQQARKRGFGAPLQQWFRAPEGKLLVYERLIAGGHDRGCWSPQGVERLLLAHQAPDSRDFGPLLWRLLMLDAWARHYIDRQMVA